MDRRRFLVAVGSSTTGLVAGCITSGSATGEHDVGMTQVDFRPETLTVDPGTTVLFRNTSSHSHTVTALEGGYPDGATYFASGGYDSQQAAQQAWENGNNGILHPGDTFEHTFEIPGEYRYFCIPHVRADMRGTVVVRESKSQ